MKKLIAILSLILCLCLTVSACADVSAAPGNPEVIPEGLEIDWEARYTYAELEAQMQAIADAYPDITKLYEIGNSWRERSLWCMEITNENIAKENKPAFPFWATFMAASANPLPRPCTSCGGWRSTPKTST